MDSIGGIYMSFSNVYNNKSWREMCEELEGVHRWKEEEEKGGTM